MLPTAGRSPRARGVRALLCYHAAGGVRVAQRAGAMGLAGLVFSFGMSPDLLYTLQQFALSAVAARPGASGVVALALLGLGFAWLARRNNPDLTPDTAAFVARLGAALAVATYVALLANALLARRPPWGWARSLPWSAAARVWLDAAALALPGAALLLAAAVLDWRAALAAAAVLAFTACVAAAALRLGAHRLSGAAGQTWLWGIGAAALVSVWPWLAVACALAAPLAAAGAARRDRGWRVTRWEELHHDASGDPAWNGAP